MKKRLLSVIIMLLLFSQLSCCFNYREINKITFVTSIIFDKDEYGNIDIYLDCVTPYRNANESSDKGKRVLFHGNGKTALEAMRDTNVASSNDLNFSQVRAYIFTENVAIEGVDKYINLIENDQELSYKTYMFIYFGEVNSLLSVVNNDEEYLGLYLDNLVEMNKKNGKVIYSNVSDYITSSLEYPNISLMSAIELEEDVLEKKVLLKGGVIMQDNHIIKRLEEKDCLSYNLLTRNIREGTFQVPNPNESNKFVTLDILQSYNDSNIKVIDDKIVLEKYIRVNTTIGEIQGKLDVDENIINLLKNEEEERLKRVLINFYNEYKKENIDILKISRLLHERFPKYNNKDILDNTTIDLELDVIIDGSSLVKESK